MTSTVLKYLEGDIVRLQDDHTDYYVVEWHEKKGCGYFDISKMKNSITPFEVVYDFSNYSEEGFKVIGNIYENPELLEV